MKKKFIKNSKKIFYTLFVFIYTIMQIISPVMVSANTSIDLDNLPTNPEIGDIYNSTVTAGSLENEGDVLVTKTVTKTNTLGEYTVTFNIKGKKVTTSTEIKKPLYAVVVFDRSGSMNCTKYSYDRMGNKYCAEVGNKWESAVNGAKTFAETLLNKVNNAQIALVGFSGNNRGDTPYSGDTPYNDAETLREFANINLDDANFGSANGGTNLQAGLLKANELLSDTSIPENAVKYVVVISDGQPTFYYDNKGYTSGNGNSTTKETYKATIGAATTLKNQAEVFSIGYMLPSGTVYGNKTAADILTEVSSPNKEGSIIKHYVDGKPEDVANAFTNIAEEISTANAGTNAQLTDKLGNAFSFVDGNGNTYTSSTIGEITEEGTSFSFNIKIDEDSSNGWHPTNNGFILKYTNYKGEEVTLNSESDPLVYWEAKQYNYVIKYYLDDTNGNPIATENGTAPLNEEIKVNEEKHLSSHIGYEYTGGDKDFNISKNEEENIAIIVYTKVNYNYVINYYKDSISEDNFINRVTGTANYKDTINVEEEKFLSGLTGYEYTDGEKNITISTNNNENIVNIVYTKKNYNYEVRYYLDSLEGTHLGTVADTGVINEQIIVNEELKLSDDKAIGYAYNGINLDFTIEDTNELIIVNVIYNKVKYNWQVNYYKDSISEDNFINRVTGTANYKDTINVEEEKFLSGLTGYEYTDGEKNITISTNNNENIVNIVYTKKNYNYEVRYYLDSLEGTHLGTVADTGVINEQIIVNEELKLSDDKAIGYAYNGINLDFTIEDTNELIIVNVIYNKVKYNWQVNYYKDSISEDNFINRVTGTANYKDTINVEEEKFLSGLTGYEYTDGEKTITISTNNNENIVNIVYTKKDYEYTVKYYFDGVESIPTLSKGGYSVYGSVLYASAYNLTEKEIEDNNLENYILSPVNPYNPESIVINTENNLINIYYVSKSNITNQKVTKKTNDIITSTSDIVNYNINYTANIKNAIGEVKVIIKDTLPLEIDTTKSNLNGGSYNASNNTITWTKIYNVKEFTTNYDIKLNISYSVAYKNIDADKSYDETVYTNKINVCTDITYNNNIINGNCVEDSEDIPVEIYGDLVVKYVTYENNKEVILIPTINENNKVGTPYNTKKENIYGYEFVEVKGNPNGKITEGTTTVIYVYKLSNGNYTEEEIEKTSSETIDSIDSEFNYTIKYNVTINDYIGEATTTITDNLPYEIDETNSNLNGGVYDKENNTITWIIKSNITENNRTVTFNKEISVVYLNINDATVTNEVTGQTVFGNTTTNGNEDKTTTIVDTGKVIARYIEKDTNKELQPSIEQNGLVGTSYETKAGDTSTGNLYGYKLVKIEGNETGKIVKGTTYVTYIYEKNNGSYEEEIVNKTGNEFISSINSPFEYEINYNVTINDYIGEATTTIVDTLPYEIDETKSNLNGGIYDKENKTITWIIKTNIDENNNTIEFNKTIEVIYIDIDNPIVSNNVTGQTVFGNTTTNSNEDETTTIVDTGKVIARYIEKDTNKELQPSIEQNGLVGTSYETKAGDTSTGNLYGYKLVKIEGNETGKIVKGTTYVTYIYEKNNGSYEEEIVNKTGNEFISSINSPFEYEINYNVTINDYIGEATTTIVDTLPYEIDETKSNLNGGIYDKENKTITWIIKTNIDENNNTIEFNKTIEVIYIDIDNPIVSNNVTGQTVFGNTTTNGNEDETTTIVDTGKVIAHYIEKETNVKIANDTTYNGLVGSTYVTEEKDIEGYFLSTIEGETTGVYDGEKVIEVTYIYEKKGQGGDINPPHTGLNIVLHSSNIFNILGIITLTVMQIIKKKKETNI